MGDLARRAVERVLWRAGVTGDACARVAAELDAALESEGFSVLRLPPHKVDERLRCPVCGRLALTVPPYADYAGTVPLGAVPPYENVLGKPSYEVCSVCDFEFGNDDNPGTAPPQSFEDYRREREQQGNR